MYDLNVYLNRLYRDEYNEEDEVPLKLYEKLPINCGLYFSFKHRKAIKNFLKYQYSRKASTYIEKSMLRDIKIVFVL